MANEKRLIDANALIARLEEHSKLFIDAWQGRVYMSPSDKARVDEIDTCIAEIINAPTVDAVEVVHGRWLPDMEEFDDDPAVGIRGGVFQTGWKCSICGRTEQTKEPYCNCGAKMDGGDEDD
jgi:hypothetical protein